MANHDCPFCRQLAALDEVRGEDLVAEFAHSVVLLGPWQYYLGYCMVVARRHATELSQLGTAERHGYFEEMCLAARAIEECFQPHKLNYELLGNQVPHLHWHLFPRYAHDPEALSPVWLALHRAEADDRERQRLQRGHLDRAAVVNALKERLRTG